MISESRGVRAELLAMASVGMPVIFTNMTLTAMQVTDAWMLGMLGNEALAAVTPPGMAIFLLQSFGYSFLTAVTTYVAQSFGRGEERKCGHYAWQGIWLSIGLGLLVFILRSVSPWFFGLFPNESPAVLEMEVAYFDISLFSLGPALVTIAISNFFIGIRRNRVAVLSALVGLSTNVLLNYGLIFGAMGFPEWGFEGAAWGTVFATMIETIILGAFFFSPGNAKRFGTRRVTLAKEDQVRFLRVGLPAGMQGAVDVAAWGLILSWLVTFFGTAHQAAATVLIRCMQISFIPAEGVAVAALTLIGAAVGVGDFPLAERRARSAFRVMAIYMSTLGILYWFLRRPIMEVFSDDPQVIAIGASAMIFVSLFQVFDAMNISYLHALQAVGDNLWPSLVNLALCLAVLLGGGLVVVHFFPGLGSQGIWALTGLYILGQGLAFRSRWTGGRWKEIDLFRESES